MGACANSILLTLVSVAQVFGSPPAYVVGEEVRISPPGVNLLGNHPPFTLTERLTLLSDGKQRMWAVLCHYPTGDLAFWSPTEGKYRTVEIPSEYKEKRKDGAQVRFSVFLFQDTIRLGLLERERTGDGAKRCVVHIADFDSESHSLVRRHEIEMDSLPRPPYKGAPLGRAKDWDPVQILPSGSDAFILIGERERFYLSQALALDDNPYRNYFFVRWDNGVFGEYREVSHGGRSSAYGIQFRTSPDGTTHVSWLRERDPFESENEVYYTSISPDGGAARPNRVGVGFINHAIAVGVDDVYLLWEEWYEGGTPPARLIKFLYVEREPDGWTAPQVIPFPALECSAVKMAHCSPQIAAFAGPDRSLYVVLQAGGKLLFSMRSGETWTEPIALDSPVGDVCDPQVTVDAEGTVHLAYFKSIFRDYPDETDLHELSYSLERSELANLDRIGPYEFAIYRRLVPGIVEASEEETEAASEDQGSDMGK